MLTPYQEKYLSKIPENTPVAVYPWDARGLEVAQAVMQDIKSVLPENEIVFIGSLPLKIAGQKDIDLSVLSPVSEFPKNQAKLEGKFGSPDKEGVTSIAWHFVREGWDVAIYLTDPVSSQVQEQIEVFKILKNNPDLLKEYEHIKLEAKDKPYKEYQRRKYEFYNRILGYEKEWYFTLAKNFVKEAFIQAKSLGDILHLERTVYWLTYLQPNANEALRIAAISHDIERAFRDDKNYINIKNAKAGFTSEEHLAYHQTKGAEIMAKFLQEQNAPQELIDQVYMLISKHEVGGNEEQNLLKDADSISYFENQIDFFLTKKVPEVGKEKVRNKFQWMFDRITSERAKELAKPMFEEAMRKLEFRS